MPMYAKIIDALQNKDLSVLNKNLKLKAKTITLIDPFESTASLLLIISFTSFNTTGTSHAFLILSKVRLSSFLARS